MSLTVNEIFYSLQGEGGRSGSPSIFIRLTKCNLACSFCDTDFRHGNKMSLEEIYAHIQQFACRWIIWTGGEPTLQLTDEVLTFFRQRGYKQAIETNGTRPVSALVDYITCSPKVQIDSIKERLPRVDEIRMPIGEGDSLPDISTLPEAKNYFVSPIFDGNVPLKKNIDYCVQLVKQHPQWTLSLQIHKLIGIE